MVRPCQDSGHRDPQRDCSAHSGQHYRQEGGRACRAHRDGGGGARLPAEVLPRENRRTGLFQDVAQDRASGNRQGVLCIEEHQEHARPLPGGRVHRQERKAQLLALFGGKRKGTPEECRGDRRRRRRHSNALTSARSLPLTRGAGFKETLTRESTCQYI